VVWDQATGLHDRYARIASDELEVDDNRSPTETQNQTSSKLLYWENIVDAFLAEPPKSNWIPLQNPEIFHAQHSKVNWNEKILPSVGKKTVNIYSCFSGSGSPWFE